MDFDLFDTTTWPVRPLIMGVVNVTPDSFSDGGAYRRWDKAVSHALQLVKDGADVLDVGGESTRPGAEDVDPEEEIARVVPVIRVLAGETDAPISVDTRKPEVAAAALDAGARLVNDVGGLRDPAMLELVASTSAGACIMHMPGTPRTMQAQARYDDVVGEVLAYLGAQATRALEAGVKDDRLCIDPGIGFGKTLEHNLALLAGLDRFASLGYPVVVGASRKRFIEAISGDPVQHRLGGSLAAIADVDRLRCGIVRVHDVQATRQFFQVRARIHETRTVGTPATKDPD